MVNKIYSRGDFLMDVYYMLNTITADESGLIQNIFGWMGDSIKDGLVSFCNWALSSLLTFTEPFYNWGCKSIIVICILIFFLTGDKKTLTTALKTFFVFIFLYMMKEAFA